MFKNKTNIIPDKVTISRIKQYAMYCKLLVIF